MSGRRLVVLVLVLAAVGIPAVALRVACVGRACTRTEGGAARIPFCPLPGALKADLVAGYREGRSPDVLAVARESTILGGSDPADENVPWPMLGASASTRVPIVFAGTGVDRSFPVPPGTGLDQIAPTIAEMIGLRRPHPSVRAGVAITGVANRARPRLVLEVALEGVGSSDVSGDRSSWPELLTLERRGTGTLGGTTGSLPLDPAATLTTIGTGGLPSQHGITGTFIRNDTGQVVRAWGRGSPPSVIATLPDDLDRATHERAKIGLVAADPSDRGLIGMNWYVHHGTPRIAVAPPGRAEDAARRILAEGFGHDAVPDLLAVVLPAGSDADAELRNLVGDAERASRGSTLVVVAGTGADAPEADSTVRGRDVAAQVDAAVGGDRPLIAEAVPGGLFLDQGTLAAEGITGQAAVDALLHVTTGRGQPMMADAFQGFAVSFARYC